MDSLIQLRAPNDPLLPYLHEWKQQGQVWPISSVHPAAAARGILIKDMATPTGYHWNGRGRDEYNKSCLKMTPILYCDSSKETNKCPVLWLGGSNAANDEALLRENNVPVRRCLKGKFGCKRSRGFHDLTPFHIFTM